MLRWGRDLAFREGVKGWAQCSSVFIVWQTLHICSNRISSFGGKRVWGESHQTPIAVVENAVVARGEGGQISIRIVLQKQIVAINRATGTPPCLITPIE
jgi:hypothetical protein